MIRITLDGKGETQLLLDLLQKEGASLPACCGGNGTCGKCKVHFLKGMPEPSESEKEILSEAEIEDGWRLACRSIICGTSVIEFSEGEDTMHVAGSSLFLHEEDMPQVDNSPYIVAVDIGTTTIAAARVNSAKRMIEKVATTVNHQRSFGADVISRIEASNQGKGALLQQTVLNDLERLVERLGLDCDRVKLVISANTTMGHILQGLSCHTIGKAPYTPVDLSLHTWRNMEILPGISAFVGGDMVSGILACNMDQKEEISLLVDLGTNGEMIIGNRHRMLATSTAAGPALEGGNIQHGIAGVPGAIAAAEMKDGSLVIDTIQSAPPVGICGSGVIEIVYELLQAGIVDETGHLNEIYAEKGYPLTQDIVFTARDVREVQLAKSAIRAGLEVILKKYGITYKEVDRVYIAGGFGEHINLVKAVGIGLFPEELLLKMEVVGNSSLAGAVLYAEDHSLGKRLTKVAEHTAEISLAGNAQFSDLYMEHMFFPEESML